MVEVNVAAIQQQDASPPWLLMPNLKDAVMEALPEPGAPPRIYKVSTNSLGFRGPEVGEKGRKYRILLLGDSSTFGLGVNDNETWPHVLQDLLDPSGEQIQVINAAFPGASSLQGLHLLMTKGLLLEPDLVLVSFGLQDSFYGGYSDWSRLAEIMGANPDSATATMIEQYLIVKDGEPDRSPRVTPGQYVDALYEFKDLALKANFSLVYVVWPHAACFGRDTIEPTYHFFTFETATLTNTPLINMRDVLESKPEAYLFDPIHATVQGNQAVANFVADELRTVIKNEIGPAWVQALDRASAMVTQTP